MYDQEIKKKRRKIKMTLLLFYFGVVKVVFSLVQALIDCLT